MGRVKDVDEYIASAPKGAQPKLRELRTAIRAAAPNAEESPVLRHPPSDVTVAPSPTS